MKTACPKNCLALHHPEAGFFMHTAQMGEIYQLDASSTHHLIMVLKGRALVNSEECENFFVYEQQLIFCYREFNYRVEALEQTEYMVVYFTELGGACDMGYLTQLYRQNQEADHHYSALPINATMQTFVKMMKQFLADGIECKHLHHAAIQHLYVIFRFYYPTAELLNLFYNVFDDSMTFRALVRNNCSKAKTLNELAALCGYDISVFNVTFRRHFKGVTPYAWMQEQRSKEVLHVITNSGMTISEIAEQYGFSNAGHLSSFCRKFFGDTPTRLREKHRAKGRMPVANESN